MKWLDTPSKIVAFAVAIVLLTWTVIQIWDWYESPSEELTAVVSISPFTLPPTVESTMLSSTNDEYRVRSALVWLKSYNSEWIVTVQNSGQKTLNEVILRLQQSGLVELDFADKPPQVFNSSGIVNVGTLAPGESAKVNFWTDYEYPDSLTPYIENQISLVHSSGIGKIKKMVTVENSKWLFVAEHPYATMVIIFWIGLFVWSKIENATNPSSSSKKKKTFDAEKK
jgi:hypothetical protein